MMKILSLFKILALTPLQILCSLWLVFANILPTCELFDRSRFLLLRALGVRGKGRFTIVSPVNISPYCAQRRITIDGPSFINTGSRFAVPPGGSIIIERNVAIGPRVQFECMNHGVICADGTRPGSRSGQIRVRRDAWIGAGCIILADVTIGEGAVVAAGSVVNRDVPAHTLVAGVPAKVKKNLIEHR